MVTTLAKINAGFLGLFMVQCLVAPQFLMDSNFVGFPDPQGGPVSGSDLV